MKTDLMTVTYMIVALIIGLLTGLMVRDNLNARKLNTQYRDGYKQACIDFVAPYEPHLCDNI